MSFASTFFSVLGLILVALWVWDRREQDVTWSLWLQATGLTVAAVLLLPLAVSTVSVSVAYAIPIALPAALGICMAHYRPIMLSNSRRIILDIGLWSSILAAVGFVVSAEYILRNGPYSGGAAFWLVWLVSALSGGCCLCGRGAARILGCSAAACGITLATGAAIAA